MSDGNSPSASGKSDKSTKAAPTRTSQKGSKAGKTIETTVASTPPSPPSDDTWKSSVESRLDQLGGDIRKLLVAGIALATFLIGAAWNVYSVVMTKISDLSVGQEHISGKVEKMETKIEGKFELMDQRMQASQKPKDKEKGQRQ